jgi:chorismate dehydratase
MSLRLGAVSFLNSRPLTTPLEEQTRDFDLVYAVPARCAADLHSGAIDLGLIPAVEYVRGPCPYSIVPQVAVGCRGAVLTVRLFYRGELGAIRRLALDPSSRTSATLVRILLKERYGLEPELVQPGPDLEQSLHRADAALLIGDPVFPALDSGYDSLDLGQEWYDLTGLPFVFAFWAGRPGLLEPRQVRLLIEARRQGQAQIGDIAASYAASQAGVAALYRTYLSEHIRFDLDTEAVAGLERFFQLAQEHGLIASVPQLDFYSCA